MIGSKSSSSSSVVVLIGDSATDLYLQDEMRKNSARSRFRIDPMSVSYVEPQHKLVT